jgi:N-acetylmuramoyl-L-alanine amidase
MRKINKIIVHCSATPEGRNVSAATIDKWHKERGWSGIGYHYVVKLDGSIEYGRMVDKVGAHCKGHNKSSIGICYIGGCDSDMKAKDTRTPQQIASMLELIRILKKLHPGVEVFGHRDFSTKECPSFDAKNEYCNA